MQRLLSLNIWMSIPQGTRQKLAILFEIPRSGETVVAYQAEGAVVQSDGYTAEDLFAITIEKMQTLTGVKSDDFYLLFEETVDHVDAIIAGTYEYKEKPKVKKVETVEVTEKIEVTEEFVVRERPVSITAQKETERKLKQANTTARHVLIDGIDMIKDEYSGEPRKMKWFEFTKFHAGNGMGNAGLAALYKTYK